MKRAEKISFLRQIQSGETQLKDLRKKVLIVSLNTLTDEQVYLIDGCEVDSKQFLFQWNRQIDDALSGYVDIVIDGQSFYDREICLYESYQVHKKDPGEIPRMAKVTEKHNPKLSAIFLRQTSQHKEIDRLIRAGFIENEAIRRVKTFEVS